MNQTDAKQIAEGLSEGDACWLAVSLASAHVKTFGGHFTHHVLGYQAAIEEVEQIS